MKGKRWLLTPLIVSLPVILFVLFYFGNKNRDFIEKQKVKKLNQDAYDLCCNTATDTFIREWRDYCWRYNHDAIGCDLSYLKDFNVEKKIVDIPKEKLEEELDKCLKLYPPSKRLYVGLSPEAQSGDSSFIGTVGEIEAVRKILNNKEVINYPNVLKEGYKFTYTVSEPTEDNTYWEVKFYQYKGSDEKPLGTFRVDTFTGELSSHNN